MERRLARGREYLRKKRLDPEWHAKKKAYLKAYHDEYRKDPVKKARRDMQINEWGKAHPVAKSKSYAKYYLTRRGAALAANVKRRAKLRGFDYDLDDWVAEIQARIDAGVCEITGYPFDLTPATESSRRFNAPSIDRIDNSRGYTYDNIRIVLCLVNVALNDWGEDTLREVMLHWLAPK